MAAERDEETDAAMAQWYYSDEERNRHGPLEPARMIELHQRGELRADTLVWRDGLSQWRPWRELAGELVAAPGFAAAADPGAAEQASAERTAQAVAAAIAQAEGSSAAPAALPSPSAAAISAAAQADADGGAATTADAATATPTATDPHSPYSAPRAEVAEHSEVVQGQDVVPGGFWRRVAAYLIDSTLVGVAYYSVFTALMLLVFALGLFGDSSQWLENSSVLSAVMIVLGYGVYGLISIGYYAGLESSSMQATLGKLAVGIKVVDAGGARLSRGRAFARWASSFASYASFGVGYLMAAFTERKRGLHDLIAGTQVVDRWAYTARADFQRRDLGPVTWVVLILGGLVWLGVVGFMAAIFALGMR
ncbi:RDD family protein [Lysobacter enzymogenes]|uniref:RDD family protein n=1 Tax=Lysobacter enzymogenes TaxID=69 RepID=UPI001A973AF7|nr:RDD family protein [Lysobacter enzymogenes]QQP95274.1 RDD family protein [Lysobacter enzymogenes]